VQTVAREAVSALVLMVSAWVAAVGWLPGMSWLPVRCEIPGEQEARCMGEGYLTHGVIAVASVR